MKSQEILEELMDRFPNLNPLKNAISEMKDAIIQTFGNGGKVMVCGNGGSASDANHLVAELMKNFEGKRPLNQAFQKRLIEINKSSGSLLADSLQRGIAAVSLCSNPALITAILNDQGEEFVFAQQVVGLGAEGDILIGFSTSGNSKNIINAFITARAKQIRTIGITGHSGGELKNYCDILINVPEIRTAWIQELHLPVYHAVCRMVEKELFD